VKENVRKRNNEGGRQRRRKSKNKVSGEKARRTKTSRQMKLGEN